MREFIWVKSYYFFFFSLDIAQSFVNSERNYAASHDGKMTTFRHSATNSKSLKGLSGKICPREVLRVISLITRETSCGIIVQAMPLNLGSTDQPTFLLQGGQF